MPRMSPDDRHAKANAEQVRLLREALGQREPERHPRWWPPLVIAVALLGLLLNWRVWQDWGILAGAGVVAVGAVVVMWVSLRR